MGFAALAEMIPLKDWLYAGLFVILLAFGAYEYRAIEAKGAAQETQAVQKASAKATADATKHNDELTAQYTSALVTSGETYAKAIQAANDAHAADMQRLQHRAEAGGSGANAAVGGASGAGATATGWPQGADGLGSVPGSLGLELADALRTDDAALMKCYADRDSLTGK